MENVQKTQPGITNRSRRLVPGFWQVALVAWVHDYVHKYRHAHRLPLSSQALLAKKKKKRRRKHRRVGKVRKLTLIFYGCKNCEISFWKTTRGSSTAPTPKANVYPHLPTSSAGLQKKSLYTISCKHSPWYSCSILKTNNHWRTISQSGDDISISG